MVNKQINKKTAFWIVGLFIIIVTIFVFNIRVCAPCTYQFNDRDYNKGCAELCASTPKWKVILFNATGINFDYKEKSQILPKPL